MEERECQETDMKELSIWRIGWEWDTAAEEDMVQGNLVVIARVNMAHQKCALEWCAIKQVHANTIARDIEMDLLALIRKMIAAKVMTAVVVMTITMSWIRWLLEQWALCRLMEKEKEKEKVKEKEEEVSTD